jgi:hypothetical protein
MMVFLESKLFGEDYKDYTSLLLLGNTYIHLTIIVSRVMGKA